MLSLVTAVIKPHRLDPVKDVLQTEGVVGMTVTEVRGFGRQGGHSETYRGAEYLIDFIPKVKIEIMCKSEEAARICELITDAARTGRIGDGKVWVTPVDNLIRVRTGERDHDAL